MIHAIGAVDLQVTRVTTEVAFRALEREWGILFSQANGTIFQSFEWLWNWWRFFGGGRTLHCLLFRNGSTLVGIAPMFQEHVTLGGVRLVTRLQFLGHRLSDYLDFLILPGFERPVLHRFVEELAKTPQEWHLLDLEEIPEHSPTCSILAEVLAGTGARVYAHPLSVCPRMTLPGSWDTLLSGLGPETRQGIRRKLKRLREKHSMSVEVMTSTSDDLQHGIGLFSDIHQNRWHSLGHPSAFEHPDLRAFHTEVARGFAARGWLRLYIMRANGAPVASAIIYALHNVAYMYQCNAYAPPPVMRLSPGMILKALSMEDAIGNGQTVYDFLRGDEAYKTREWKATPATNRMIRGVAPATGRIRFVLFLIVEFLGKSRGRILMEIYEFRRFKLSSPSSLSTPLSYISSRAATILLVAREFFHRYFTTRGPR